MTNETAVAVQRLLHAQGLSCELVTFSGDLQRDLAGSNQPLLVDGNISNSHPHSSATLRHLECLRLQSPPFLGAVVLVSFYRGQDLHNLPGGKLLNLPGTTFCRLPFGGNEFTDLLSQVKPLDNNALSIVRQRTFDAMSERSRVLKHRMTSRLMTLNSILAEISKLGPEVADLILLRRWWSNRKGEVEPFLAEVADLIGVFDFVHSKSCQYLGASIRYHKSLTLAIDSLVAWRPQRQSQEDIRHLAHEIELIVAELAEKLEQVSVMISVPLIVEQSHD